MTITMATMMMNMTNITDMAINGEKTGFQSYSTDR
jgi:hypothetical protein